MAKAKGERAASRLAKAKAAEVVAGLRSEIVDAMRHAVAMGPLARPTSKRCWGKRNRYAVGIGEGSRLTTWDLLTVAGLASCWDRGADWGRSSVVMYSLTAVGCAAVGMHEAAIERAVEP